MNIKERRERFNEMESEMGEIDEIRKRIEKIELQVGIRPKSWEAVKPVKKRPGRKPAKKVEE